MKYLVLALLCLLSGIRCAEIESEEDKNKNKGRISVNSKEIKELITARVEPTEEPRKYVVYLSWPKIEADKKVRIRLTEVLTTVGPNQTTFAHEVDHNQTLTYLFEVLDSASRIESKFSKLVIIPQDLVFGEAKGRDLTEDIKLKAKRAFFLSKSEFSTNGFKFDLEVEELISDNGTLQTYPESSKAEPDLHGKAAGDVQIKARSASGKLKVFMRGQHGGDGANGAAHINAAASGAQSGEGESHCTCGPSCHKNNSPPVCTCKKVGVAGGTGATGAPGNSGGNAGNGGSTGRLTVLVQDGREFDLQYVRKPGLAGLPGKGSKGQLGGAGGPKRKRGECVGPAGASGKNGPDGQDGHPALDGKEDQICIYIASEEKNDCI